MKWTEPTARAAANGLALCSCGLTFLSGIAHALDGSSAAPPGQSAQPTVSAPTPGDQPSGDSASPPELDASGVDSVVLVSGEVLRGRIGYLREDLLGFGSRKLGDLALGWGDVVSVRSPRRLVYVDDQLRELVGPALVTGDDALVRTPAGVARIPRAHLLSIVPHDETELEHWGVRVNLGATLRKGNSDTTDLTAALQMRRQDSLTRLLLDANAAYGEISGAPTVEQTSSTATFDVYLSRAFYVRPLLATAQTDRFKNVQFRGILATGGGLTALNSPRLSFRFRSGWRLPVYKLRLRAAGC